MRKMCVTAIITIACLFLASCQFSNTVESYINIDATEKLLNKEKEVRKYPDVGDEDIFDFAFINGASETEESHEVDEIIKMYASTWSIDELHHPIAIDIENNEIYVEPNISLHGVEFETDRKKVDDTDKVLDLFEQYDVLHWQNYYSNVKDYHSYEDGASWRLVVQYEDGTIEIFRGEGTSFAGITPDHYTDFMNELGKYVNEHLDK